MRPRGSLLLVIFFIVSRRWERRGADMQGARRRIIVGILWNKPCHAAEPPPPCQKPSGKPGHIFPLMPGVCPASLFGSYQLRFPALAPGLKGKICRGRGHAEYSNRPLPRSLHKFQSILPKCGARPPPYHLHACSWRMSTDVLPHPRQGGLGLTRPPASCVVSD